MFASTQALLSAIVDYAGLFPPAQLDLPAAMSQYSRDRVSHNGWMLDQFVVPMHRLPVLTEQLAASVAATPWEFSVIVTSEFEMDLRHLLSHQNDHIRITGLEFPPRSVAALEQVCADLPPGIPAFFEIPFTEDLAPYLTVLNQANAAAKIRTGGLTAAAFPTAEQVCHFIQSCVEAQVPFKATAGLHHPLPGQYPLTEAANSDMAAMQGFLNIAIAAAFLYWQKISKATALQLLNQSSIEAFRFTDDCIYWGQYSLNLAEIIHARHQCFRSFGSCSFAEPIHDLQALQLLGDRNAQPSVF